MTLKFAKVVWFNSDRGFGVAGLLLNGATVAFHRDRGRHFYRGTDSPELRLGSRRLDSDPKPDDAICLIESPRKTRKGESCAELWAMADDWDAANRDIEERHRKLQLFEQKRDFFEMETARLREDNRLRCDPKFRLVEEERRFGKPTSKPSMIRFEGTKSEFDWRQKSRTQPLQTANGKILDGFQYVRFFKREIIGGWRDCENPLTINLPPLPPSVWGFEEACFALRGAKICRAPRGMMGVGFLWRKEEVVIARGNCAEVFMIQDDNHEGTWFKAGDAEYMWEQGDKSEIGVLADSRNYIGDAKAAHDLAQLGRSSSEWERIGRDKE